MFTERISLYKLLGNRHQINSIQLLVVHTENRSVTQYSGLTSLIMSFLESDSRCS